MTELIIALVLSSLTIGYWVLCRKRALKKQKHVADLFEAFSASEESSDSRVATLYLTYRMARHWLFMPLAAVIMPFVVLSYVFKGGVFSPEEIASETNDEFAKVFKAIMDMYSAKNPLTSFSCILLMLVSMSVGVAISMVFKSVNIKMDLIGALASIITTIKSLPRKIQHITH